MIDELARKCIRTRKDYIPGKPIEEVQREFGLTDIIKMASNENPFGTSPLAIEAMIKAIQTSANRYPESLCVDLAGKVAFKLGVNPSQLFFDNGGDGVITMIGLTFINPDDHVITSELTFPAYENITAKMGGQLTSVPLADDDSIDLDGFIRSITPRTKLIFICNPNNPTGKAIKKDVFLPFIEKVPNSVMIVIDEAYFDFVDDPDYPSTISLLAGPSEHDHPSDVFENNGAGGLALRICDKQRRNRQDDAES